MSLGRIVAAVVVCLAAASGCCSETPQAAAAKKPPDCTKPSLSGATPLPSSGKVTGGTFSGTGPITIGPGGPQFDLTSDLVVWSDDDLIVDGNIDLPYLATPGAPSINVTLGAKKKVVINGRVGGGRAAPAALVSAATAKATAGTNGGHVKVVAGTIDVEGRIDGNEGGAGGDARAIGIVAAAVGGLWTTGGDATAVGGTGGSGGDVILCADLVIVAGSLNGASAGRGGNATAVAAAGHNACACGANGGQPGDIIFGAPAQVDIKGSIFGGMSWWGGDADASVLPADSGNAEAYAGQGAAGGAIVFQSGTVVITTPPPTTSVLSGNGGAAGDASAAGGDGANGRLWPDRGGNAKAVGGAGGKPGPTPQLPLPNGTTVPGTPGTAHGGGDAKATGGDGGTNTSGSTGANSGSATAKGGSNGNGVAATGGVPSAGPATATGSAGATAPTATQVGAP